MDAPISNLIFKYNQIFDWHQTGFEDAHGLVQWYVKKYWKYWRCSILNCVIYMYIMQTQ